MTLFRWRLFWTLTILSVLMLLAVLLMATEQPAAGSVLSLSVSRQALDPVVETLPAKSPPDVSSDSALVDLPEPAEASIGAVELWHSWAGRDGDALAAILERFHQTRPNIRVEAQFVDYGDLAQAYATAVQAGEGPDLILAPNWWIPDLAAAGVLLPIDNQITGQEREQFFAAAIENLVWEGMLYGLPTDFELVALYYNRRLLDDGDLPGTTEDMVALAVDSPLQGAGIYTNFYHLFWGITAYGGSLFDEDGRVILEQSPGAAAFLAWLKRAGETPGIHAARDYGMLMERFKKEEFALFVDGPWSMGELRQHFGADLGVATLPAGPHGPARPWLSADGVFLNPAATADQQALALTAAQHITNAESASILARTAGRLPAHKGADLGEDPLLAGFAMQAIDAVPQPHKAELDEVWVYATDMVSQVLGGSATPEEAVIEAATLINEANGK